MGKEDEGWMSFYEAFIPTPIGDLRAVFSDIGLRALERNDKKERDPGGKPALEDENSSRLLAVRAYITDHFYCRDPGMRGIELDMEGISSFRKIVYKELMKVGSGEVVTYGELADRIGLPGAARAVGGAMGKNPFLILVPCHRVVAAGKESRYSIGGFGCGIETKAFLLALEGHNNDEIEGMGRTSAGDGCR